MSHRTLKTELVMIGSAHTMVSYEYTNESNHPHLSTRLN